MNDTLSTAVFVDRDGTIMEDCDYCSDPKDVKIFPGVREALLRLKSKGFKLIIITNQSGIGRGLMTVEQYRTVEAEVLRHMPAPCFELLELVLPQAEDPVRVGGEIVRDLAAHDRPGDLIPRGASQDLLQPAERLLGGRRTLRHGLARGSSG